MSSTVLKKSFFNTQGTLVETIKDWVLRTIGNTSFVKIGIIKDFDAATQTASVQPAIKRFQVREGNRDITLDTKSYPVLPKVPVVFPSAGGWAITFPVKAGDECLLMMSDSSLNNWKKYGGEQEPSHRGRTHSIKDAVALVGVRSPGNALSSFNEDDMEIRNDSGTTKFTIKNGEVTFNGDITVTGGDVVADGISLKTHVHPAGTAVSVEDPISGPLTGSTIAPTGAPT